jgi:hypothetical protein
MLLKSVPLVYFVPDARMLPVESLRVFQVDQCGRRAPSPPRRTGGGRS